MIQNVLKTELPINSKKETRVASFADLFYDELDKKLLEILDENKESNFKNFDQMKLENLVKDNLKNTTERGKSKEIKKKMELLIFFLNNKIHHSNLIKFMHFLLIIFSHHFFNTKINSKEILVEQFQKQILCRIHRVFTKVSIFFLFKN